MSVAASPPSQQLRNLRILLGLNQRELGWLLGLSERSVLRLEKDDATRTGFDDLIPRVMWLMLETRVEDVEAMLRQLLVESPLTPEREGGLPSSAERQEALRTVLARLNALRMEPGLRLKDARVSRWVYWATGERADEVATLKLARDDGIICRPVVPFPAYLANIAPGDRVLLCHNATPLGWFQLRKEEPRDGLPPFFRFVAASSKLGAELKAGNYRLMGGERSTGKRSDEFSCLSVEPVDGDLRMPAPRGRGIRDTMTPYVLPGERRRL